MHECVQVCTLYVLHVCSKSSGFTYKPVATTTPPYLIVNFSTHYKVNFDAKYSKQKKQQ